MSDTSPSQRDGYFTPSVRNLCIDGSSAAWLGLQLTQRINVARQPCAISLEVKFVVILPRAIVEH